MTDQGQLFGRFGTEDGLGPVGDELGRCFTPLPLAQAVVDAVEWDDNAEGLLTTVLEPSVGGGAFVRAARHRWPLARILGVDIDPRAEAFELGLVDRGEVGDFPTVARFWDRIEFGAGGRPDLIVGNPPFGKAVGIDVTIAHVHACLDLAQVVALVLPLPYLCGHEFDAIWRRQRPAIVRVIGRPWPTRLREVAVFEWRTGSTRTDVVDLGGWP